MQYLLMMLALVVICGTPLRAAEPGPSGDAPTLPRELAQRTASLLEHSPAPADAATELLVLEQLGEIDHDNASAMQRWLTWYQQLDHYHRADFLAQRFGADWSPGKHNSFWLQQAEMLLQRGRARDAERALRRMREPLEPKTGEKRQSLLGLILMQQARFTDALAELENRQGFPRSGLYDHYNFGVALVGQGRKAEGMALLDELGQTSVGIGKENHALLDRANLAVGWSWLAAQQGGTARAFFKRVSLDGPHSGLALLGLGWAELAPDGKKQDARFKRQLFCEDVRNPPISVSMLLFNPYQFCRPGKKPSTFKYHHLFAYEPGGTGTMRFRRALRPWLVLSRRQEHDPAVQEALLAIGYAYEKLREYRQAENFYQQAVQRYEAEIRRLVALETALKTPAADPQSVLAQQARADEFIQVRADNRYLRAIAELESLQASAQELLKVRARIERYKPAGESQRNRQQQLQARWASQDDALNKTRIVINQKISRLYLDDLAQRRERINQYLANTVLALALLYDRHGATLRQSGR
jgi:tetratricopeptide (TPR) repeat protein